MHFGTPDAQILLPESYAEKVRSIEHKKMLVAVSPKLQQRFEVDGQSVLVVGITPDEQRARPWWLVGSDLMEDAFPGEKEMRLGHHVASRLGGKRDEIRLGDEVFRVSGGLDETGSATS